MRSRIIYWSGRQIGVFINSMNTQQNLEDLMARMQLRDQKAFSELYSATSSKLFGVILRVLKDRAAAEDVLQEVFVKIWNKADRYKVTGHSPMTWLITVARNAAIDRLRASGPRTEDVDEVVTLAASGPTPEQSAVAAGEASRIVHCLGALEADRADAVRGVYLDGQSYQEMAERYSVPLNTMKTWLRRSLASLKECLAS